MVSMLVSVLVQFTPGELRYVVESKLQNASLPVIGAGNACTVTTTGFAQPVAIKVYEIVVVPTDTLVTRPPALMLATPGLVLLHKPPVLSVDSSVVLPIHTPRLPVVAAGSAFTVMVFVRTQPVPIV